MNLAALETLATAIKAKNKLVTVDSLITESLFHKFGTLNEEHASELLWAKRQQIETSMRKEGYTDGSVICPFALEYNAWSGEKAPWS